MTKVLPKHPLMLFLLRIFSLCLLWYGLANNFTYGAWILCVLVLYPCFVACHQGSPREFPTRVTKGEFRPEVFFTILTMQFLAAWGLYEAWTQHIHPLIWAEAVLLYFVSTAGVSLGYHRLFTHTSYEATSPILEKVMAGAAAVAFEGVLEDWVRKHHAHHAFADKLGDPHTPKDGFWWSHWGWLFYRVKYPAKYNPKIGFEATVAWQKIWYWPIVVSTTIVVPFFSGLTLMLLQGAGWLPALWAGWQAILVAGFLRLVIHHHGTWGINSVGHVYGYKPVNEKGQSLSKDTSRNPLLWAILTFIGEWLHGNHHADPNCAIFGWGKWDLDLGKWLLWLFERLGWVRRVNKHAEKVEAAVV